MPGMLVVAGAGRRRRSGGVAPAMLRRHPDLGLGVALELGSKVATGEMTWG
ncbi:hypothetical protein ACODT3_06045 [Streptomyces sp. 4.24]|uniref:hypothetical protein n=1 Tax=Streptomyces tritrimontium TaxID=3406573 RepID=UPI003BB738F0